MQPYFVRHDIEVEEAWDELKDCFKTLCIKCLAFEQDGEWLNVMTTGFLTKEDEDSLRSKVMRDYDQLEKLGATKLERLLITYDIQRATDFPKVIRNICSGSLAIHGQLIKLGEITKSGIEGYSHLLPLEPYNFPRISFIAHGARYLDSKNLSKAEEGLKAFGYASIDELGLHWLMLEYVRTYSFSAIIDIPIYFLPLTLSLEGNTLIFDAMCHKALASKLRGRLTLKKLRTGKNCIPAETHPLRFEITATTNDIGTVRVNQSLSSALSKEDAIEYVVTSKIGIIAQRSETVGNLLQREVLAADFPKLVSQFIDLDKLEALVLREEQVGGEVKTSSLSFQRAVAWLLSTLGFQVAELEGTKYKELKETNGTRREIDMLICDPETKKMYVVDLTLRTPKDEKIDDIANLQLSLQRRGVFVEPMIITKDYAGETKKNVRHVRILDYEDLQNIINKMRTGNIQEIKKIVAGIT